MSEGIELPNRERVKEVDYKGYKYLRVFQLDKIMNKETKESIGKEYISSEINLHLKFKCREFHFWHECLGYKCGQAHWRYYRLDKKGRSDMDLKTRKIMALNRCLHPRSSVEKLFIKQNEGGKRLCWGLHNS